MYGLGPGPGSGMDPPKINGSKSRYGWTQSRPNPYPSFHPKSIVIFYAWNTSQKRDSNCNI